MPTARFAPGHRYRTNRGKLKVGLTLGCLGRRRRGIRAPTTVGAPREDELAPGCRDGVPWLVWWSVVRGTRAGWGPVGLLEYRMGRAWWGASWRSSSWSSWLAVAGW